MDAHVAVWIYLGAIERLSPAATEILRDDLEELAISPIVELEMTYLHEIGRLDVGGPAVVADLRQRIGLKSSDQSMASVVAAADALAWTRDPFDRLIVGDASAAGSRLLTKDRTIREHYPLAQW